MLELVGGAPGGGDTAHRRFIGGGRADRASGCKTLVSRAQLDGPLQDLHACSAAADAPYPICSHRLRTRAVRQATAGSPSVAILLWQPQLCQPQLSTPMRSEMITAETAFALTALNTEDV